MEQTLISKKELLQRYGISYGALYRWKRKGLIPEEWFIKKSAVTGQETYFPEALICGRIDMILEKKDDLGLDELAQKLREDVPSRTLILQTVYGERSYLLREIKEMYYETGNGLRKDILEKLLHICDEMDKEQPETTETESPTEDAEKREPVEATEPTDVGETAEPAEVAEVAEATEPAEAAEAVEAAEVAEATEVAEAAEPAEAAEVAEDAEVAETAEVVETAEAVETVETTETVEMAEVVEMAGAVETAEATKAVDVAEATETAASDQ